MKVEEVKITVGQYRKAGRLHWIGDRIYIDFGYWPALNDEIKQMQGRRYHGYDEVNPRKWWSIPITPRNIFQLDYLLGKNPYAPYDAELPEVTFKRPLFEHQRLLARHMIGRHYCIVAAEMGTGKTLAAIEAAEQILESNNPDDFYYVAPRAAIAAVQLEFKKWNARVFPTFVTYEGLVKIMKSWPSGKKAPRLVIFDESSKIKTPTAIRSQAALALADGVRNDWGRDGYVIAMSGSPAPKSPADWWFQCEVTRPGFLVEGDINKFKNRLGLIVERENPITGGKYPYLVTWKDDEAKCAICGKYENDHTDDYTFAAHEFQRSKNEVLHLYKRLQGLVLVKFKKDCLDLPEKQYRIIECKPASSTLRAAKLISESAPTAIRALTLLRELSDGFQYADKAVGEQDCPVCAGTGVEKQFIDRETGTPIDSESAQAGRTEAIEVQCTSCGGSKKATLYSRVAQFVKCPKDDAIIDLLDMHEDVGRIVNFAGFQGSIDRVEGLCHKQGWTVVRVDGRGWRMTDSDNTPLLAKPTEMIEAFQSSDDSRIAFVAHPGSAGMSLTLTASPTIVYYSNDFNAESRIQSEDRIHRPGMDVNRGATIIDLVHLPTDKMILDNLKLKRDLQSLSLGDFRKAIENIGDRVV